MADSSKKKDSGFGGTLLDLGAKDAKGVSKKDDASFAGHFSDMGSEDAIGVGKGK